MSITALTDPLDDWDNLPDHHSRILYDNKLTNSNDNEVKKAIIPNTWERWTSASGTMTGYFQASSAATIKAVAIGAHNLFSAGATSVTVSTTSTTGSGYVTRGGVYPTSDRVIWIEFDRVEGVVEIKIEVIGATNAEIGLIYAGDPLRMYQPIYGGHTPIDLSAETEYQTNSSVTGQFLGRNIIKKGFSGSFSYNHLDPYWVRDRFMPFVESAKTKPFFINWRPDLFDASVLCYATGDIKPSNMGGGHRYMQVSFSVRGHADV